MFIKQEASPAVTYSAIAGFVGDHSRRCFSVLHREGAAEAAAFIGMGEFHQVDSLNVAQ